ncbi:MAG: adenosine deaminase [Polaromonas sp.]|nr:adenosine deaminase [Polaromonas sp.]
MPKPVKTFNPVLGVTRFIAGLPKAELHMHIEGSIEPLMMFQLASRNGISLRWNSVEELREAYRFDNLQSFLDLYYDGCRVLVKEQDFHDVTIAYLRRASEECVRHTEMFIGPQGHTRRGIAMATVLEGVLSAMRQVQGETGITSGLILGAQRHLDESEALTMLEDAMPWAGQILGFGLGGAEVGNPPEKFARFFAHARERGFKITAHSGEEGPAAYVQQAVHTLRVDRVDHGNTAMNDPALVRQLAFLGTPLTVCPLSNLRLHVVEAMTDHPLKKMLEAGLCVTVNSDDPSYFRGYINANFAACNEALALSLDDMAQLARNSFTASFLPDAAKKRHVSAVNEWCASFREAAVP